MEHVAMCLDTRGRDCFFGNYFCPTQYSFWYRECAPPQCVCGVLYEWMRQEYLQPGRQIYCCISLAGRALSFKASDTYLVGEKIQQNGNITVSSLCTFNVQYNVNHQWSITTQMINSQWTSCALDPPEPRLLQWITHQSDEWLMLLFCFQRVAIQLSSPLPSPRLTQ